jgi:hypothetical protein
MMIIVTVGNMYTANAIANVTKTVSTTVLNFDRPLDLRLITS